MKQKIINFSTLFFSVYFILYILPFPFLRFPAVFNNFLIWLGHNILKFDSVSQVGTGSGDKIFDFVDFIFVFATSFIITFLLLFTRPAFKEKLLLFSITFTRFFLSYILLSYGFYKFGEGQFLLPNLFKLDQRIGDMSPMGMLWTFMGTSPMYSAFGGFCQVIAGLLLLYRKTSVLGAIVAFGVILNVMVLNFSYDVPVKLFSIHLILMIVFILYKNSSQIVLFLMGYPSKITFYSINFRPKWLKIAIKALLLIYLFCFTLLSSILRVWNNKESITQKYDAIYTPDFNLFPKDSLSSSFKWNKLIIDSGSAKIFSETDTTWYSKVTIDEQKKLIVFNTNDSTKVDIRVYFKFDTDDKLELFEADGSKKVIGKYNKTTKSDFELLNRDFNWITEIPYKK